MWPLYYNCIETSDICNFARYCYNNNDNVHIFGIQPVYGYMDIRKIKWINEWMLPEVVILVITDDAVIIVMLRAGAELQICGNTLILKSCLLYWVCDSLLILWEQERNHWQICAWQMPPIPVDFLNNSYRESSLWNLAPIRDGYASESISRFQMAFTTDMQITLDESLVVFKR